MLVSETMLQQTQVARVAPRYEAFLERFPNVGSCASAPLGDVLRLWDGLGYNRRGAQLHRAAVAIVTEHAGRVPDSLADLLSLPGVGAYTARAVLAFAYERDVGVVDTNAARVLARAVAGRTLTAPEVQAAADAMVPAGSGWAWNQAVLDLGATVCGKRAPRCGVCPVESWCAYAGSGGTDDPAVGSAGTSRTQSRFAGSDRQGRGRLLAALRQGPVAEGALADAMGWTGDAVRAERVCAGLVREGLVLRHGGLLQLP